MSGRLNVVLAQLNFTVGAIAANRKKIVDTILAHPTADLIVFPELALTGYPLEDMVQRQDLYPLLADALDDIAAATTSAMVAIGHPTTDGEQIFNTLSIFQHGKRVTKYHKQKLPNYGVFDEQRYFTAGQESCVVTIGDTKVGFLICEDLWTPEAAWRAKHDGAELLVSVNASPYEEYKLGQRLQVLSKRVKEVGLPIVYVNHIGGQDQLIFDGNSLVVNSQGEAVCKLAHCEQEVRVVELEQGTVLKPEDITEPPRAQAVYQALVLALKDYVEKNGFSSVVLGLSGGIDSAVTLALAADALGPERVRAVMMPYHYTADISVEDARQQAEWLGCQFDIVPIAELVEPFMQVLPGLTEHKPQDTTEENLQARCRGVLLMALSNKEGSLLLSTGNKSELAVGYCTLYGDMNGGFAPIKDVPKGLVYELAVYRNSLSPAIPERVITREPSAELAPNQRDQDSLPPYDTLDEIIAAYVEQDSSIADLVAAGYDETVVRRVITLIERNEYKRRQGALGPKITSREFSKDRRYPVTNQLIKALLSET